MMEEVTWAAVGLLAVSNMASWLKIIYDNKKGNGKNNYYHTIMKNETRGLLNKQVIDAMCKTINGMKEENKEDHKTIFNKLDKLFEKVK
jgi:hypothetical protein